MGNLFTTRKGISTSRNNIYEPFVNHPLLEEQIQLLSTKNKLLEDEIKSLKKEIDVRASRIDITIQNKYNELINIITYQNQQNNEKINIITKDMENLLNNDKILLDKLIEKNIVSTIQEQE